MLCYATLRYATLRYATLRYAMLWQADYVAYLLPKEGEGQGEGDDGATQLEWVREYAYAQREPNSHSPGHRARSLLARRV